MVVTDGEGTNGAVVRGTTVGGTVVVVGRVEGAGEVTSAGVEDATVVVGAGVVTVGGGVVVVGGGVVVVGAGVVAVGTGVVVVGAGVVVVGGGVQGGRVKLELGL